MGGIVHDKDYIKWAQYSMNRLMGANLKTDGQVTPLYRLWVNEFQVYSRCPTVGGQFDKWTQDYVIAINNVDTNAESRLYMGWVQHCLNVLGFGKKVNGKDLNPDGAKTKATKAAICAFQSSVNHKHIDGVVGPKTERDLCKKVPQLLVPGFSHGPVVMDPVQHQRDQWLESTTDIRGLDQRIDNWVGLYIQELIHNPGNIIDPTERLVTQRMLPLLARRSGNYKYITKDAARKYANGEYFFIGEAGQKIKKPITVCETDALISLRGKVGKFNASLPSKAKFSAFKASIRSLYKEIDDGIREVYYQYGNGSGTHSGTYSELFEWYKRQHQDIFSIIGCVPEPNGSDYHPF